MRSLMAGDAALASVSHVIVDEVHERDRHCDFLLLVLRDMLARCRGLRLVLMSATADLNVLTNYFRGAVVLNGKNLNLDWKYQTYLLLFSSW